MLFLLSFNHTKHTQAPPLPHTPHYIKHTQTLYHVSLNNRQQKPNASMFPKFDRLPAEIRLKIWQDSIPRYGVYSVLLRGREEPISDQSSHPVTFRVVYSLEPLPRDQRDHSLSDRIHTTISLLLTCSESASEVKRTFPDTIKCTSGKLRFNAKHDLLNLSCNGSILAWGFLRHFARYQQGSVACANDWHKIPQRIGMNSFSLLGGLEYVYQRYKLGDAGWESDPSLEGFMQFLDDCASLRHLVLASPLQPRYYHQRFNEQDLYNIRHDPTGFNGPTMPSQYYYSLCATRPYNISLSGYLRVCASTLRVLAHGQPRHQVTHAPLKLKSGCQELRSLNITTMIPLGRLPMELQHEKSCAGSAQMHPYCTVMHQQQLQDLNNFFGYSESTLYFLL